MPAYFIGIDSGTQSTKALLVEFESGKVISEAAQSYGLIEDALGTKEQHPRDWIDAVEKTILAILSQSAIDRSAVKGIGVSGQQHGFVPLDKNDQVIRPAKLWNDTSTQPQCEYLINELGGVKKVLDLIGNNIFPGYTVSKIRWLKENEPENYKKLKTILLPHNYVNFWFTGEKKMEYGDASGTAILDVKKRTWAKEVLQAVDSERDLASCLPSLQESHKVCGTLRKGVAEKLGLTTKVIVSTGGGDNMMAAIGTGNVKPGIVTASFGTSGTIYAYSQKPVIDLGGELASFCDSTGAWLPLICTMNVTVATELAKKAFGYTNKELDQAISKLPVGSKGLVLLPYFSGERTPNVPDGTGVYFGINPQTFSKAYFTRAAMEGATLGMRYGLEILKKGGIEPSQIRLTGGGSKSPLWRQMAADIFNCEVICIKVSEGAALGGALQAMWAYSHHQNNPVDISEFTDKFVQTKPPTQCSPKKDNVERYQEVFDMQTRLSKQIRKLFTQHKKYLEKFR